MELGLKSDGSCGGEASKASTTLVSGSKQPGDTSPKAGAGPASRDQVIDIEEPSPGLGNRGKQTLHLSTASTSHLSSSPLGVGEGGFGGLGPKGLRSPSTCSSVSPVRSRHLVEPLVEEDSDTGGDPVFSTRSTGRSGSAGTLSAAGSGNDSAATSTTSVAGTGVTAGGGFPQKKRASLHHAHGKKLTRRSSFLVDTACATSHMNVFPKATEPLPQPVLPQTRRCSLTLPYPALYGSWQAAQIAPPPVIKSVSNELAGPAVAPVLGTRHCTSGPPPLFKRRSVAQFDMSSMSPSEIPLINFPHRRPRPVSSHALDKAAAAIVTSTMAATAATTNALIVSTTSVTTTTSAVAQEQQHVSGIISALPVVTTTAAAGSTTTTVPHQQSIVAEKDSSFSPNATTTGAQLPNLYSVNNPLTSVPLLPSPEEEEEEDDSEDSRPIEELGDGIIETLDSQAIQVQVVDEPYLLAIHLQKVPMKDFGAEVRATLDVAHFLNQAVLLLDINENSLEGVVDAMLLRLFRVAEEHHCTVQEIKSSLFAHDSVHLLARTIQGTTGSEGVSFDYDQSWLCAICNLPSLQRRHVAIARLKHPANFGRTSHEIRLFVLVICPSKEKGTKNALETGRTFSTIFSDMEFRHSLLEAHTEEEFKRLIIKQAQDLSQQQSNPENRLMDNHAPGPEYEYQKEAWCRFGTGIKEDLQRRLPHYISDYRDGVVGYKTVHKTISTTLFLYFACILPAIAFGVLNDHTTRGIIDVKKVIVGQTLGELFYVILSGQPLNILLTTAPLCLFVKIVYALAEEFDVTFEALYCCVGLWSSLFTALYALFDVSRLMRWSTRSTEEIFALFISIAFCVDAFRDTVKNFQDNYSTPACKNVTHNISNSSTEEYFSPGGWVRDSLNTTAVPTTVSAVVNSTLDAGVCHRDSSILFLLLMLGTLWLGVSLYNFNKTPYLQASKREALADYSLPVAVLVLSFIGSFVFQDVRLDRFHYNTQNDVFTLAPFDKITVSIVFASIGLGFSLSLLIFMDQNITSAMVNNPCNKLKKGPAYHWDLFIVAIINGCLSIFTMPWMHATLPHSPLHMRSLADVEERVDQGHVYEIIVRVRETRLTGIFSHLLIGLSIFLLPYPLGHIPIAVLDGLFLYMAVTALNGNQMFERITLLFMEQAAYPPNHYIRRVPQRKIHQFTGCQVLQLSVMCIIGFVPWAYVKMVFPITLLLLLPIRHKVVPLIMEQKYLDALDGEHQ